MKANLFSKMQFIHNHGVRVGALVLLAALVLSVLMTGSAFAGNNVIDWAQCANDDGLGVGQCKWQGSNVNTNQGQYSEGMAIPERLVMENIVASPTNGNTHKILFASSWLDNNKHSFDWIVSWDQARKLAELVRGQTMTINECGGLSNTGGTNWATDCNTLTQGTNFVDVAVPVDNFTSGVVDLNTVCKGDTACRMSAFDKWMATLGPQYATRSIRVFGAPPSPSCPNPTITSASITRQVHVTNPADTNTISTDTGSGSNWVQYELTYTSCSPQLVVGFAGHIATGLDPNQPPETFWGAGFGGAGLISGSSYHFKVLSFDGDTTGQRDNQMAVGDSPTVPTMVTQLGPVQPHVSLNDPITDTLVISGANGNVSGSVSFSVCGPTNGATPCLNGMPLLWPGQVVTQTVSGTPVTITSPSFAPSAYALGYGTYCFRTVFTSTNTSRTNGYSSGNAFTTVNECQAYNAPTAVTLSSFSVGPAPDDMPRVPVEELGTLALVIGALGLIAADYYVQRQTA